MRRLQLILMSTAMIGIAFCSTDLFAWHGGHYRYYGGQYYGPGRFWYERSFIRPPYGAFFPMLPDGYTTIVIAGSPYLCYDNVYYRPCPGGYVVVEMPSKQPTTAANNTASQTASTTGNQPVKTNDSATSAISTQNTAQVTTDSVATINIPNSKGTYTAVRLVKKNNGYVGPQGEFYEGHPTVAQLKALYGN